MEIKEDNTIKVKRLFPDKTEYFQRLNIPFKNFKKNKKILSKKEMIEQIVLYSI
jgi:hypothetical protein